MRKVNQLHEISSFSRYIFSIAPRCKSCEEKVLIAHSVISFRLWVVVSVISAFYLLFMRPPNFDFVQYALLWVLSSFIVRRYMIFFTEDARVFVNQDTVSKVIMGKIPTSELTKNIAATLYFMLYMFLSYLIVTGVFHQSIFYFGVMFIVIIGIVPFGRFGPMVEVCMPKNK